MIFEAHKIIGQSSKLQEVLRTVDLVAMTDVPVLISGEVGTGKDLFAQRVHRQSLRKQRPFIKVDCEVESKDFLPDDIKKGVLGKARSGTLFLDEVSVLSDAMQLKLLKFIEKDDSSIRLIVSTQKNLLDEVNASNFRAELFYRLNVIPVELPTLKEREGDVSLLMDYFFRNSVAEQHQPMPSFTKAAQTQLSRYSWAGNVRELQNFCERMFILFSGKQVDMTNLPEEIRLFNSAENTGKQPFFLPESGIKLDEVEVDLIRQALHNTNGNKSRAARLLGLTRDTFLYRLKKYSIDF